jgi:ribonuclease Y
MFTTIVTGILAFIMGFAVAWYVKIRIGEKRIADAEAEANAIIEEAKNESESLKKEKLLEAKEEIFNQRQEFEREAKEKQREFQRTEQHLSNREVNLDRKLDVLNKKEQELDEQTRHLKIKDDLLARKESELEQLIDEENERLERISGLSTEEAKRLQMQNMLEKAKEEVAIDIQEMTEQARKNAVKESREIVVQALQRATLSHVVDSTVSTIHLPDDEMKGRIIGREGRNIRAFEAATGIEVLIDDTPQTVTLSGFDPMRREIARLSLKKLIYDGRIHPGRIEEVVEKTKEEIGEKILEMGEQTLHDIGLHGLHPELVRLIGRQHYRTTYGQNLLQHSKEVATLAGQMASQLGLDIALAKRAGLLHDIGKAAEEFGEAPFYDIGLELSKKYGENEIVQNVIASQAPHTDNEVLSPITTLVQIADSISVSRPGAQKEMLENYIKRMRDLEEIAASFPGVLTSYALQAGKELRVIVEHSMVDDNQAQSLASKIVEKLHAEMEFPGQVKITVIREYRAVDFAR